MLLQKKNKILSYIESNDISIKDLGINLLQNNITTKISVWFYLKISSNDIKEILFQNIIASKTLVQFVRANYKEMDEDSREEFWKWLVHTSALDVTRTEEDMDIKKIYAYFK